MPTDKEQDVDGFGFKAASNETSTPKVLDRKSSFTEIFRHTTKGWLNTALPLAEFLLLLTAIMMISVAPIDMPGMCGHELQTACVERYIDAGGVWPSPKLAGDDCPHARVECWRSGYKDMLYEGKPLPSGTKTIDIDALALPNRTKALLRGDIAYCLCLLSNDGQDELPQHANQWKAETNYFCEAQSNAAVIGTFGLVAACVIVTVKALVDAEDFRGGGVDEDGGVNTNTCLVLGCAIIFFIWSVFVILITIETALYDIEDGPQCVQPDAGPLYYVFVIGIIALIGSSYAMVVTWVGHRKSGR
jgi:hypothetical protein